MDRRDYLKRSVNIIPKTCRVVGIRDVGKNREYCLMNYSGKTVWCKRDKLKEFMRNKSLYVVNLQIDKAYRLVMKKVDLKSLCRAYSYRDPLSADECGIITFYGLAKFGQLNDKNKHYLLNYINKYYSYDADDLCSMIEYSQDWTVDRVSYLDTQARDGVLDIIYIASTM